MKKLFIILFAILINQMAFSVPLTGTKTIKKSGGNYSTFAAAINDLNTNGVGTGGVIFLVDSNFVDTAANLIINTTTSDAANPIIFRKKGTGNNPVIIAGAGVSTTLDGIIIIAGTDNITFERINLMENSSNVTTTTQMEWGYAILKGSASNGSKYVTIKNCVITLNKSNAASTGIYMNNHTTASTTTLTVADTNGLNSYCKFYGDTISNVYRGIYIYGYSASSPYTLYDQYNQIGVDGPVSITNFGGSSTAVYGLYAVYQNNIKIANIYMNGGAGTTTTLYGIYTSTGYSSNVDIYNCTLTLSSNAATSTFYGIYNTMGSTAAGNTVNIYNNVVQNCSYTTTSGSFYCIYNSASAATVNMYNNRITGNIIAGTGTWYLLYGGAPSVLNMHHNIISGNQKTGTGGTMYLAYSGTTGLLSFNNNRIYNNSASSASSTIYCYYNGSSASYEDNYANNINSITSGTGTIYGMYMSSSSTVYRQVYTDTIYGLSGGASVVGIYAAGTTLKIFRNQIYNLYSATTSSYVDGIYVTSGTYIYVYNNNISDLKATNTTSATGLSGLYFSGGTNAYVYYNTVYLNATNSTSSFGSAAIYTNTTPNVELRNNIFVNISSHGITSGNTVAFYRSSTTLTTYATSSNNNCFYAGTPGTQNLIFYDGTNSDQTISAFKSRVSARDANSFSEIPPFINVSTTPYNLHLSGSTATSCESGGSAVNSPITITDDCDGNTRNTNFPDVGADEGSFTINDNIPPMIWITPLPGTAMTSSRTLTVTIMDPSGVPTTGTGLARLYWKKNYNGTYTGVTATSLGGNIYTFSFGSGVAVNDTVFYYIVAQDNASTPNVSSNPLSGAAGFSVNPPACSTPPTTPYSYRILTALAGGNYNIGGTGTTPASGCTYVDLTAAFADIAKKAITGPVNLVLTSYYKSSEEDAFPVVISPVIGASNTNTITIKPAAGVDDTISGSSTTSIIKFNGADFIVIDGSNNGTTSRNLTIMNTSTSATTAAIWIASASVFDGATYNTVKNCNISTGINSTATTYGITITGTSLASAGTNNDNNTIQNNAISKAYVGIYAAGTVGDMDSLSIIGNTIGATTGNTTAYIGYKGIDVSNTTSSIISQNTIYNIITSASTPIGMLVSSGVTNTTISKNNINNIVYTGTGGYGARGININTGDFSSKLNINNNIISVIGGDGYSSFSGSSPVGMYIDGLTGGLDIYHNSINMSGTLTYNTSTITTAILFYTSTITNINLRNNIFVNTLNNTANAGAKNYAIYSNTPASNFITINFNDYFVSSIQGVLGFLGTDINSLSGWRTVSLGDANSISADPVFNSSNNLQPNTGSPVLSAGTYISSVPTDYNGSTRSKTTASIGAFENSGDYTAPVITCTPLGNTSSTTSRTFTTNIADPSGVPTSGIGLPRLYWKKNYNGTYSGVTATSLGSNNFSFIFGSGVVVNDTIFYYVVAQDNATTPNVTSNPLTGAAGFSTNPPACSTPPTVPYSYKILPAMPAGNYNIGGTGSTPATGCTYVDLTAAFSDIATKAITGPINLVLTSYYQSSEEDAFPVVINPVAGASSSSTVTIKPAAGVNDTISGSSTSSIIKINGADFIIIDGSNSGTSSRNLTIMNTSTSATTAAIWIASVSASDGATYNTVKNCNISTGINSTATTYGITITGTTLASAGTNNDNNTIQNNAISKAYVGIYAAGTAGDMDSLFIIGNMIGASTGNTSAYIGYKGIDISNTTNSIISQNTIYNIITTAYTPIGMLVSTGVTNTTISKNNINNIVYSGTGGYGARGINIITNNNSSNLDINNNAISVIGGDGYTSFSNTSPVGMYIDGVTGGLNIYYNSINMNGTLTYSGASITTAILFYTTTITNINLRNNIFVNTLNNINNTGAKNYAIYSNTPASNFITINYNDYYVSSAQGVLGFLGSDISTLSSWRTASLGDANSISADPLFNSTTNLQPNSGSPILAAGIYLPSVLTDFNGATRSTSTPSIGAFEIAGDFTAPVIAYTPFGNTSSTLSRTLTATITDASGVPTSGIGLPRLYWKKNYNGTYSGVTATYLGSNNYSFTYGSGVSVNDTIFYYIVAQDNASTQNITSNPLTGAAGFSANPPACSTPPTPYFYMIIPTLPAGNYNIGGTGTTPASGCTYVDLTAAFNDINKKEIQGSINLILTSYYNSAEEDAFPIVINAVAGSSATKTVTIKPATGLNTIISGSSSTSVIKINGADNIIIDGSNNNTTSRNLTIANTSTSATTAAIWIASISSVDGATQNTIKNCNISTGVNTTATTYGITITGTSLAAAGTNNDNNTIKNNVITKAYVGIYAAGTNGDMDSLAITNNVIGDTTGHTTSYIGYKGIDISQTTNSNISQNTIYNIITTVTTPVGMLVSTGVTNTQITRNNINNIRYTSTGGYGARGIYINTASASSNLNIINNSISSIGGDGYSSFTNSSPVGIYVDGTSGGLNFYYNSVNMNGTLTYNTSTLTTAILFYNSAISNIRLLDNVFVNTINNTNSTTAKNYAIYSNASAAVFTAINYNDYFVSGTQGVLGYLGSDITSLSSWKTATGKDTNSLSTDPVFTSADDLHFASPSLNKAGIPVSGVTVDISGSTRSTTTPDIGAYEINFSPIVTTLGKSGITSSGATINGSVNAMNEGTATISFEYGISTSYGSTGTASPSSATGYSNTGTSAMLTGLNPSTLYHYRIKATNTNGTSYGFDSTFTTNAIVPVAVTDSSNSITGNSANVFGHVNPRNSSTTVYFRYGKTTAYGDSVVANQSPVTGNSNQLVSASLTGLIPNTLYYYAVSATNSAGNVKGNDLTFTTKIIPATATTLASTAIKIDSATLNGSVNANNASTVVTFHWGTSTSYGNTVTATQSPVSGSTATSVSYVLPGLNPNTTYHYRVVATNSAGTVYGADTSFTTLAKAPSVQTTAATGILADSATLNGNVIAQNLLTNISFNYGLTTSYGSNISGIPATVNGMTSTASHATIKGLLPNTVYHYRITGTNAGGTSNGKDTFFTSAIIKAVASTTSPTGITTNSATLNGLVNANNASTTVSFEYGLTTSYGNNINAIQSPVSGMTSTAVSASLTGLIPNNVYHYRVVAVNAAGTTYGADSFFNTLPALPVVQTEPATTISGNGATLNGKVDAQNSVTHISFEYGKTIAYGSNVIAIPDTAIGLTGTPVSAIITGLEPNTLYHYRVIATNIAGTVYGADSTFMTAKISPTVTTDAPVNITSTSATLNGTVVANNDTTTVSFEYGLTTAYGATIAADQSPVSGLTPVPVTFTVIGLLPNTTYHYRVMATNTAGTVYGFDTSFTTTLIAPDAVTNAATLIGTNNATLNGSVVANNDSTTVTFEFGMTTGYGMTVNAVPAKTGGITPTPVEYLLSGLKHSTTYHYRVVATNSAGTTYGNDTLFTTGDSLPVLTTDAVTSITSTTAVSGGSIIDDGGQAITAKGVCWSTSPNPDISGSKTSDGTGSASFISNMTGLTPNTPYYVRAYATNSIGTSYGNQVTFTTEPSSIDGTVLSNSVRIFTSGKTLHVNFTVNADIKGNISVLDMLGQVLAVSRIMGSENTIDLGNFAEGYYLIRVDNDQQVLSKMVLVK